MFEVGERFSSESLRRGRTMEGKGEVFLFG